MPPKRVEDGSDKIDNSSNKNFGITAYFILFLTSRWFASFVHTLVLIIAYAPIFPEKLPFDRDVPLEIIGPTLGYMCAIYFIGTSYGKVVDTRNFLQIFVYLFIAQVLHFTLFWFEDAFIDHYKPNGLLKIIYDFVNGSSFLPLLCCQLAKHHLKDDENFKPQNSCFQNCLSGCCVCIGRLCLLLLIMPLGLALIFGEDNGNNSFRFDFGGNDFGGSSYDTNSGGSGAMTRSKALRSLKLGSGASLREIKSSYRKLAKLYHPDKCGRDGNMSIRTCEEKFIQVKEGYEYLSGKNKKERRGFRL